MLSKANISHRAMEQYAAEQNFNSLKVTAIVSLLDHHGYLKQTGLLKRKVKLTEKGKAAVENYQHCL